MEEAQVGLSWELTHSIERGSPGESERVLVIQLKGPEEPAGTLSWSPDPV